MKAYERLLSYVKVFTPSSEETGTSPSTQYQFDLARLLVQELKELGVKDADVDEHCYVYGHIPATRGYESRQKLGFIAHMDTVSDFCDHPVTPVITPNYDGKDLALGTSGRILSPKMFPHLSTLKGRTLITSDGTTILGADDKAGIAEIMTIIEHLNDNTIPHGPLCIAFTPDEEIGMGPAHFDIKKFGADFAYTLDGDTEGEIQSFKEFLGFSCSKCLTAVQNCQMSAELVSLITAVSDQNHITCVLIKKVLHITLHDIFQISIQC